MNAYELADAIEDWDSDGQWDTPAATMLRQQADRIAELEGEVSHLKHINKNWSISEGLALQRIAELEKEADRLSNHADELRKVHADRIKDLTMKLNVKAIQVSELERKQQSAEPVAWWTGKFEDESEDFMFTKTRQAHINHPQSVTHKFFPIPLYTTPQTKPLTDEEIYSLLDKCIEYTDDDDQAQFMYKKFARAIEERHGIK